MKLLSWFRLLRASTPASATRDAPGTAQADDAQAQFDQGLRFSTGCGSPRDMAQAVHWFRLAAGQDHFLAQFNLAMMLMQGQGVPRDDAEALVWFRRAAEGGDSGAQYVLGSKCHRLSMGVAHHTSSESRIEAYKWFHLAVAQGYKGSEAARERVTLGMTCEEVTEGNHRAAAFVPRKAVGQ